MARERSEEGDLETVRAKAPTFLGISARTGSWIPREEMEGVSLTPKGGGIYGDPPSDWKIWLAAGVHSVFQ